MPPLEKENEATQIPTYTWEEIKKHDKEGDAWVVKDGQVYDVSRFLGEHPGGSTIVMPHLGTDITEVFEDEDMHVHSNAAHAMFDRYRVGFLAGATVRTGKTEQSLIDYTKPIIAQVGGLGNKYSEYIHTPQVLDEPARFFSSDFLEFFSRTPWYIVPIVWLPVIVGLVIYSSQLGMSVPWIATVFLAGLVVWSILEYTLHRYLFHLDEWVEFSKWTITLHFLLHGVHHLLPMDPMRLVFPPVLTVLLLVPIHNAFRLFLDKPEAVCLTAGGLLGYVIYDLTHYYLHHSGIPPLSYLGQLKTYHLAHHYKNPKLGYGITSKVWDYAFNTVLPTDDGPKAKVN
mmetsp:Transcript_22698/g.35519  ORF Transcript_22698/g.35519 Transcript_22698/m.35519 type:complete len:342 (+) Transcript_22698:113-1138(+)|eukprot:CAMPEP_0184294880 /NCGR_PEP_ID=MMETSP1049-20130417/5948_1 /TAXON_ID=77928 /ORGANISM="Proteomonas sulcata, Strain CCMP704" /LENGTH=341 /DNA_ID=CAMNT_0026603299 /DNA_START=28 /DNA_END=1053 /DNA_ORIENTATION=-